MMIKDKNKLNNRIEKLRDELNEQGNNHDFCNKDILATSQKLDELILEYYRKEK